mmetsp:Transcript_10130/g.30341  ORF Transcript_10130/g.30341 Transcript_10130/m.30341 type:complete len:219 (-) Transcript_10130:2371-3027(-)
MHKNRIWRSEENPTSVVAHRALIAPCARPPVKSTPATGGQTGVHSCPDLRITSAAHIPFQKSHCECSETPDSMVVHLGMRSAMSLSRAAVPRCQKDTTTSTRRVDPAATSTQNVHSLLPSLPAKRSPCSGLPSRPTELCGRPSAKDQASTPPVMLSTPQHGAPVSSCSDSRRPPFARGLLLRMRKCGNCSKGGVEGNSGCTTTPSSLDVRGYSVCQSL